jgi:hypothetical protein
MDIGHQHIWANQEPTKKVVCTRRYLAPFRVLSGCNQTPLILPGATLPSYQPSKMPRKQKAALFEQL